MVVAPNPPVRILSFVHLRQDLSHQLLLLLGGHLVQTNNSHDHLGVFQRCTWSLGQWSLGQVVSHLEESLTILDADPFGAVPACHLFALRQILKVERSFASMYECTMYNVMYTVHSPFLRAQEGRLSMSAKTKLTLLKSRRKGSALIKAQLKPLIPNLRHILDLQHISFVRTFL